MHRTLILFCLLATAPATAASKANLRVKSLVITPSSTSVTVQATIENSGGTAISGCWMDVFATPSKVPTAGDDGDATVWVSKISVGSSRTVSVTIAGWTPEPEVYPDYVYVVVDSNKGVTESSESDNVVGQSLGVNASGAFTTSSLSLKAQVPDILNCPSCNEQPICPDCEGDTCQDCALYPTSSKLVTVHAPGRASATPPSGWSSVGWATGDAPPF